MFWAFQADQLTIRVKQGYTKQEYSNLFVINGLIYVEEFGMKYEDRFVRYD